MSLPLFPKTPERGSIMQMSYLAYKRRTKKRPIDGRSANKRMVGRKLEMSTRSGSNYLTLAGKSRFWYQIAPGALRPGFISILVLQSSWWGRESCLSSWCLVMDVWLFLAVPLVCLRFVIVVFSDHTHYFWQNLEPDLDPNCPSLYPVCTYYMHIRNQATGVSLAGR